MDFNSSLERWFISLNITIRNIDRGAHSHLKNVILQIIKLKKWCISDKIQISDDCGQTYYYENNILYEHVIETDTILLCNDICKWEKCPVCEI